MVHTAPLVVIAAGGTGGHMFPAQAFAEEMRARGWRVGLVTDPRGEVYARAFPADWKELVEAAAFASKRPDRLIAAALKLRAGAAAARRRFSADRPRLAAGFGGYPSYPALSAANALGVPILIHEQNAVLGRVNRLFARRARFIASGFDRLDRLPPAASGARRVTGNPVRAPILAMRDFVRPAGDGSLTLLVTGGSQGARLFGEVVPAAVARLPEGVRARLIVVQQAREEQIAGVEAAYAAAGVRAEVKAFFTDMAERLAAAHLVVARSGASTVTELAIVGRASILIPLGIAMDDHQSANAQAVAMAGAADVLPERGFTPEALLDALADALARRLGDPADLEARGRAAWALGQPDAARALADLAEEAAGARRA